MNFEFLRNHPESMYMCDEFMAVYSPAIDKVIFIVGDYREASPEEREKVFIEAMAEYIATNN